MLRLGRFSTILLHQLSIIPRFKLIKHYSLRNYAVASSKLEIDDFKVSKTYLNNKRYQALHDLNIEKKIESLLIELHSLEIGQLDCDEVISNFETILKTASAFPNKNLLNLLFTTWKTIMTTNPSNLQDNLLIQNLQARLLTYRQSLIHLLINTKNYRIYVDAIKPDNQKIYPLYKQLYKTDYQSSCWVQTVAETLQLQYQHNRVTLNDSKIISFLKSQKFTIWQKRILLNHMVKAGFLNTESENEKLYFVEKFFYFLKYINDDHCLFTSSEYRAYDKAMKLISTSNVGISQHLNRLSKIFSSLKYSPHSYCNFLTSAMNAVVHFSPNTSLSYWKHKHDYIEDNGLSPEISFNYHDLYAAMIGFTKLKLYSRALSAYGSYTYLHHDDQIEVILTIAEKSKNWDLLQEEFEKMYGRKQLPAIVHYSVVLNALAAKGSMDDVDALYGQLRRRNLKPIESVYAALIKSRIYHNKTDDAMRIFNSLKEDAPELKQQQISNLFSLIFKTYLHSNEPDSVFEFLEKSEIKCGNKLVNSGILAYFIDYAGENYIVKLIPRLHQIAESQDLLGFKVYRSLIQAHTRMEQFEIADQLILELHKCSDVPFTDGEAYALQYKNYLEWLKITTDPQEQMNLKERLKHVENLLSDRKIMGLQKVSDIAHEMSKFYLSKNEMGFALELLDEIKGHESLQEEHYLPFLKSYASKGTYEGYQKVINLYEKMVDNQIAVTSRTYSFLMEASLYIDNHRNQERGKFDSSLKILKFVLEAHGLTYKPTDPKLNPLYFVIRDNADNLCKIVSSYVQTVGGHVGNKEIIVHFLNQIKEILGGKTSRTFRQTIRREMISICLLEGDVSLAESLVDKGMKEFYEHVHKYNADYPFKIFRIPKAFHYENYYFVKVKLKCLNVRYGGHKVENAVQYYELLRKATTNFLTMSAYQYDLIFTVLLNAKPQKYLKHILYICEEYLVAGNIAETQIEKRLAYIYKLVVLNLAETKGSKFVQRYDILNEYYDVENIESLRQGMDHIKDKQRKLKEVLKQEIYRIKDKRWWPEKIFRHIPVFFSPERKSTVQNKIFDSTSVLLYQAFKNCYKKNKIEAYKLMECYPLTVNFILYQVQQRQRMKKFRESINRIIPPPMGEKADERVVRSYHAMDYMHNNRE